MSQLSSRIVCAFTRLVGARIRSKTGAQRESGHLDEGGFMRSRLHALLGAATAALLVLSGLSAPVEAASGPATVHAYATSDARELANTIAVSTATLLPLLP